MGKWQGVNTAYTPIADQGDFCEYLQCARLRTTGEMQRRKGYQSSGIPQQGQILNIAAGFPVSGQMIAFDQPSGVVVGFSGTNFPVPPVRPRQPRPPVIVGAIPVAPVITNVTPTGAAYVAGAQIFFPTITYDGLSGALIYAWSYTGGGPGGPPSPATGTTPTWSTNFDGFHTPGGYFLQLIVTTTTNGFTSNIYGWTFTIV
jgi:hypothetical protein